MAAMPQGSRFWVQIGEIDYQRQFVAARKKLEAVGVTVVKGWMDRDDEDEVAEAVFIVDVECAQLVDFKRQAGRMGWACRVMETLAPPNPTCQRCGANATIALEDEATTLVSCDACGLLADCPKSSPTPALPDAERLADLSTFTAEIETVVAQIETDLARVAAGTA